MIRVFTRTQCFQLIVSLLHLLTLCIFIHLPVCVLHTVIIDVTCYFRITSYDVPGFPTFICLNGNTCVSEKKKNMVQLAKGRYLLPSPRQHSN